MNLKPTRLVVLGSTGSIGRSTLDVVSALTGRFQLVGLSAHSDVEGLTQQISEFRPQWAVVTDPQAAARSNFLGERCDTSASNAQAICNPASTTTATERLVGSTTLTSPDRYSGCDVVVMAVVGSAGVPYTMAALEAGCTVALANKEALVAAGSLIMNQVSQGHGRIIPVDSEHSAAFQAIQAGKTAEVRRIVLTASGGPFRTWTAEAMQRATVEQALAHPTWEMGKKNSIDSATMMNKALEVIEAKWLFGLDADQIEVVIHPQSIVHCFVEFSDGSVIAQMSPPDMKMPIQYALTYPQRCPGPAARMDFDRAFSLDFQPPDCNQFPALQLGFEVARQGGTSGAALNAANEAAVEAFLAGRIEFGEIVPACHEIVSQHDFRPTPTLDQILQVDAWARREIDKWITA